MGKVKRIAFVGIYHETNTFAPGITELEHFQNEWVTDRDAFMQRYSGTGTSMGGAINAAKDGEVELVPGLYTSATPSGMVGKETAFVLSWTHSWNP